MLMYDSILLSPDEKANFAPTNKLKNRKMKKTLLSVLLLFSLSLTAQNINRKLVIERNNPHVESMDSLNSLSVGNGGFAMTVDGTGLQSFPKSYSKGVPLGTMSDWGWHSFDNPNGYKFEETLRNYDFGRGRLESYAVQIKDNARQKAACNWFRAPHPRLPAPVGGKARIATTLRR